MLYGSDIKCHEDLYFSILSEKFVSIDFWSFLFSPFAP